MEATAKLWILAVAAVCTIALLLLVLTQMEIVDAAPAASARANDQHYSTSVHGPMGYGHHHDHYRRDGADGAARCRAPATFASHNETTRKVVVPDLVHIEHKPIATVTNVSSMCTVPALDLVCSRPPASRPSRVTTTASPPSPAVDAVVAAGVRKTQFVNHVVWSETMGDERHLVSLEFAQV